MNVEEVRQFISDWAVVIAAVLGVIIAWKNASETIIGAWRKLNLYYRLNRVEENIEVLNDEVDVLRQTEKGAKV